MSAIGTYKVPEDIDVFSGLDSGSVIGKLPKGSRVEITDKIRKYENRIFLRVWFINSKGQRVKGWILEKSDTPIPAVAPTGLIDNNTVPGIQGTRPDHEAELLEKRKSKKGGKIRA